MCFIVIADRAGKFQAVVKPENAEAWRESETLGLEDVVHLEGTAKKDERVKLGGAELTVEKITVLSRAERSLPVDVSGKTETNFEARFDHRALDLRGERQQAIFKIQNSICSAFREYLFGQGFLEIHSPKIIATGTEGGANLFPVVYFDREAFLAQSPQFYKQMLVGAGFERVFEVAPVFRAEAHDTPFHLNEYVSLDFELGFIKDETDVMRHTQDSIHAVFNRVSEENQKELELLKATIPSPKGDIPVVHYWEIPKIIEAAGKEFPDPLADLTREEEAILCAYAKEKSGSDFVFIDNYPASKRPAYTMPYEKDARFTRGYDLLYRGLEIVTGGQRIHQYELLKQKFEEKGFRPSDFEFYFEVFKYGIPPHGGQAIGLERLTARMLGLDNVREAAFFPRDKKRLYP
jgi:nondiscriminating aspartyl-tRNA synthetase